ncbi:MAG: hypothetical protein COT26_00075 [Candidatus Kerfeldbacteria bacterium CG08_land_8_20_14_0_20_43_14]|uniref:Uncharacterized protein n=1 Tax=Candidatus Kerfeldbacteria bacterium CG08_land_8_20_14_0_20_43_14 TaxID=2014246 RepID=A0A2H0YRZ0_9BACT|nr:MAG: hypothetical protein COT26_00075 [Candidatus Kerfeldbacteria bacterium CG08_land_8_20_14_0_20_43_14]
MDKQTGKLIARISENLPDMNSGQMQRLIDDPVGLQDALRKALCPVRMIDVTTNGRSGEQCIADLESKHYRVGDYAKQLLRNAKFVATNGVTYTLAIIMGDEFEDANRTNQNIREVAHARGYPDPTVELGPYLREMFSDEDLKKMGLWALIVMHEPISDSDGDLFVLGVYRDGRGRWLSAYHGGPGIRWLRGVGFMFLVPASS